MVKVIKPLSVLSQNVNHTVLVELRAGREYRGRLDGFDPHMNLVLRNAEELVEDKTTRKLELAIVRGDNVVYVSP